MARKSSACGVFPALAEPENANHRRRGIQQDERCQCDAESARQQGCRRENGGKQTRHGPDQRGSGVKQPLQASLHPRREKAEYRRQQQR